MLRESLRKDSAPRSWYDKGALVAKLFSPTVSRWYHIAYGNLSSFEMHLLPLQESTSRAHKARARAAGHIALARAAPGARIVHAR